MDDPIEFVSGDTSPFSTSTTSNWVARNGGLPGRVRAIARAIKRKHPDWTLSHCIAVAVNAVKYSAKTGDAKLPGRQNEHASTVAAHGTAVSQWQALKARAHSHADTHVDTVELVQADKNEQVAAQANKPSPGAAKKPSPGAAQSKPGAWDPSKHPRAAAGSKGGTGGQFVPLGQAHSQDAAKAQQDKGAQANYKAILTGSLDPHSLNDQDLANLSKILYSYDTSNPGVVKARIAVANTLAKRGYDVKDFGAYGGGINSDKKLPSKPSPGSAKHKSGGKAPASHNGAKRTKLFEDGSARYADGMSWDPTTGFRKPKTAQARQAAIKAGWKPQ